jgi:predicted dehydrogenase
MRALKQALDGGQIRTPFRARIDFITGFPVFANQPFLKTLEHLIITDLGSHMLDIARWLFGEANSLYCQIKRVQPDIAGEDAATFMLKMGGQTTVVANIAYAGSFVEREVFPQTLVFIEGDKGSIELAPDFWLRVTTKEGTFSRRVPPPRYLWADPAYDVVHSSIVPCNADLLNAINTGQPARLPADNLKTMRLVCHPTICRAYGDQIQKIFRRGATSSQDFDRFQVVPGLSTCTGLLALSRGR